MLEAFLGNKSASRVLNYLNRHGEGYAMEIARNAGIALSPIQNQLERLERGGVVRSRYVGRTRLYSIASPGLILIIRELIQLEEGHNIEQLPSSREILVEVEDQSGEMNWDED